MTSDRTFVIVGASLAGAKAAETLRAEGFDGRVVLIGAEPERPYERPPLSKDYLRGEAGREKVYVHDEGFYAEHDIELRLGRTRGRASTRRRASSRSTTASGCATTGCCSPPAPSRAGSRSPAASSTACSTCAASRTADALRERLGPRRRGRRGRRRLDRRRGRRLGAPARPRRHRHRPACGPARARARPRGRRRLPRHPHRPRRADAARDRRRGVRGRRRRSSACARSDGRALDVRLRRRRRRRAAAHRARRRRPGIAVDNGILVDEHLQTSAPGVFAAGDVANAHHPFYGERVRVEHWANALHQGPVAARSMLGRARRLRPPAVLLLRPVRRRHGVRRLRPRWDRVVFRGDPASREFIAFWLADDRVVAGMNVNVWDVTDPIQRAHPRARRRRRPTPRRPRRPARRARRPPRRERWHEPPRSSCTTPASRSGSTRSRASCWTAATFAALIADCAVTGATSNPTIFAKAITGSDRYDDQLRAAVAAGVRDPQELFFELALDDVRRAADLLRPTYDAERRARRVRLVRVHARPRRRHRRRRSSRRSSCGAGSPGPT